MADRMARKPVVQDGAVRVLTPLAWVPTR